MKKVVVMLLTLVVALGLVACNNDSSEIDYGFNDDFASEVELNVAINFAGNTFISYNRSTPYQAPNGKTYNTGDLLPVWEKIGEKWNVKFVDKATSSDSNTNNQFTRMSADGFAGIDLINGTGAGIAAAGMRGEFVDLNKYIEYLPNLKEFLDSNPGVKASMTSANGGIYFAPYFDGFQEIERMVLMRHDWVKDLLDEPSTNVFDNTAVTAATVYTRSMPATLNTLVQTGNAAGTAKATIRKNYSNNIIDVMNALTVRNGKTLADALRAHIDATYGTQYAKRSDLFLGFNAAYDVDELVALMRVVQANPRYLTREFGTVPGTTASPLNHVDVYFPRDNTRIINSIHFANIFGVRGFESRNEMFFFQPDGKLADARATTANWDAIDKLNSLYREGLMYQNPELGYNGTTGSDSIRSNVLKASSAFMTYDFNGTSMQSSFFAEGRKLDPTFEFGFVLPPVNNWLGDGQYFHFSESVRSVKAEAWGIPAHVTGLKLSRALKVVDYLYSKEGNDLVLFGPDEWRDGTFDYNGEILPALSARTLEEIRTLTGGSHINYLRWYMGATLPIGHVRTLGLEYQTLSVEGKASQERINTVYKTGILQVATLGNHANPWYQATPAVYALTAEEAETIAQEATYRNRWTDANAVNWVKYGFSGDGGWVTRTTYQAEMMKGTTNVYTQIYLRYYENALARMRGQE